MNPAPSAQLPAASPSAPAWIFRAAVALACSIYSPQATADEGTEFFENKIRPVLATHCYKCHGGTHAKGGLSLDTRAGWEKGGDTGPALVPGNASASLLLKAISWQHTDLAMPPDTEGGKLPDDVIRDLTRWVEMGASDPRIAEEKLGGMTVAGARNWWAFQPLPAADSTRLASLLATPAPGSPASKPVLLRRVTYDLTGLPPTAGEMDAFLNDTSPDAFHTVVDRLLASPAYGEKWGRYWLDIVRYADTAGENTDRPLPHAWRYRNWVIDAMNRDLPYDEFVRLQLAGDLMTGSSESEASRIIATGFLAIARRFGHDIDKDMHLTYEDVIDTAGKAVTGLTLGCARCHDHKYDPITTRDYYALYGILQSSRFSFTGCEPRPLPAGAVPIPSPATRAALASWEQELARCTAEVAKAGERLAAGDRSTTTTAAVLVYSGELAPGGAQDFPSGANDSPLTLAISRGEMLQLSILPKGHYGADSTGVEWTITESGGAGRVWNPAKDFLTDPHAGGQGNQHGDSFGNAAVWNLMDLVPAPRLLSTYEADAEKTRGLSVWRGDAPCPSLFINTTDAELKFLTVTMPPRTIGLHPGPDGGVALAWQAPADMQVTLRGSVREMDPGGDGITWKIERRPGIAAALSAQRETLSQLTAARKGLDAVKAAKPAEDVAFAVIDAAPVNARIQKKGEPKEPGNEVPRAMPEIFGGQVIPDNTGSGRLQWAECLTSGPARPLTARVVANRILAGHFGTGPVATPNDFGSRGAPPENQALLDALAAEFIASGWSLKAMHRLILHSASWQRADFPRRRLTAEEVRDTLLAAGGNLDRSPGGPHPFPAESTWAFTQHGPFSAVYDDNRRSVYQMVQRTRRHPFLALFDGADPNASTPVRSQSTVPTQALYFLNAPFVHTQAKAMAARLIQAAPDDAARLTMATRELYGRPPAAGELETLREFLAATSTSIPSLTEPERTIELWAAWIRVLFGTNELLYVD